MPAGPLIASVRSELRSGRLSPVDLVERCLSRIEKYEPRVHAWVLVDAAGARATAQRLRQELHDGRDRGPLHGIPLGIKDLIDCQGWPTQAGSKLRRGHVAEQDAPLVARLREAGAILLGKTVTTEFASFDPSVTCNPWDLAHTPGGSSSGSAAAVAAGFCLAAIGSQTGGSITRPASFCGVAGCKPTFGRVPLAGIVPLTAHLDHPGPIAGGVADLALVLQAIAGYDALDPSTSDVPTGNFSAALGEARPPRLGRLRGFFGDRASDGVRQATQRACDRLAAAGAQTVEVDLPASVESVHLHHRRIMAVEAARYHGQLYLAHRADFGRHIGELIQEGLDCSAVDYAAALEHQRRWSREMHLLARHFDALVTPATVTTAPAGLGSTGDPLFNSPWSHSHLPTVSVPCGLADDGLPASLQFAGSLNGETALFGAASWCERVFDWHAAPPLA